MNLRVELVHLNSSGFQIYKFNINLFYKSNSGVEPQIPFPDLFPALFPSGAEGESRAILVQIIQVKLPLPKKGDSFHHPLKISLFAMQFLTLQY